MDKLPKIESLPMVEKEAVTAPQPSKKGNEGMLNQIFDKSVVRLNDSVSITEMQLI